MEFCKAGCSWWKLNFQTLMKTVWFSDPVMSGLSLPRTNRSSSTGHLSNVNPTVSTFCNVSNVFSCVNNLDFSTNQDWISQTVTFPNLSGRPFGTHRPVCGPWPEALIYKRQISIKSVESFLSFFNLFLFVNYILPLGGVVISSPNYINLLLKEFSWVSLFFRSAMQFW